MFFTITRSGDDIQDSVVIDFQTADGTAMAGSDYTAENDGLFFYNGETSKTFDINILGDDVEEADETFSVTLNSIAHPNAGDVAITTAIATGTILDDDGAPPIPTLDIASITNGFTNSNTLSVSVTFNESISGLSLSDFSMSGGSLSNLSPASGSGSSFTFDWNLSGEADGFKSISLPANRVLDANSNGNVVSNTFVFKYDTTDPVVALSSGTVAEDGRTNSNSVAMRASFGEDVLNLDGTVFNVTNGAVVGGVTRSGVGTYDFVVQPTAEGLVTVQLNSGTLTDSAGNGAITTDVFAFTYDITKPTATIIPSVATPGNSSNFNVQVNFSEGVTGVNNGDLQSTSAGFFGPVFDVLDTSFKAPFAISGDETFTFYLRPGAITDSAGNTNDSVGITYAYDGTAPVITIIIGT